MCIRDRGEEDPTEVDKEDLLGNLSKLDALIQDLTAEISGSEEEMEGGEGEEEFEEEGEEEFEEEGDYGIAAGGNAVDKEEADQNDDGVIDPDEVEDVAAGKKKKKKKPKPPFK
mgnify:FL=1